MLVNVLSYEVELPNGSLIPADGYNDIVKVISNHNKISGLVNGWIIFPPMFDFIGMIMNTDEKVELVVNDVVLGTISKVIKKEEI